MVKNLPKITVPHGKKNAKNQDIDWVKQVSKQGFTEVLVALCEKGDPNLALSLFKTTLKGEAKGVKADSVDLNVVTDYRGYTVLTGIAKTYNVELLHNVVEAAKQAGLTFDLDQKDQYGETLIDMILANDKPVNGSYLSAEILAIYAENGRGDLVKEYVEKNKYDATKKTASGKSLKEIVSSASAVEAPAKAVEVTPKDVVVKEVTEKVVAENTVNVTPKGDVAKEAAPATTEVENIAEEEAEEEGKTTEAENVNTEEVKKTPAVEEVSTQEVKADTTAAPAKEATAATTEEGRDVAEEEGKTTDVENIAEKSEKEVAVEAPAKEATDVTTEEVKETTAEEKGSIVEQLTNTAGPDSTTEETVVVIGDNDKSLTDGSTLAAGDMPPHFEDGF